MSISTENSKTSKSFSNFTEKGDRSSKNSKYFSKKFLKSGDNANSLFKS